MSIHIGAKAGEIAETILLPGDPLRAKFVAETMLEDVICYNEVRGMLGYTGTYNGHRVSIQGTGMGMASIGIYIHELMSEYGVKNLIRVGTCGAIQKDLKIGQVILATGASGDSNMNQLYFRSLDFAATADFDLLLSAYNAAKRLGINTIQGTIFSTDNFYDFSANRWDKWIEHNVLAVEMETQILYTFTKKFNARALSVLTVSDNVITGESSSSFDREKTYTDMMKVALEGALDLEKG
ncbi:MAG: purine-nucleoside phosphorylase [Chitinophagales bacterium]